MTDVKALFAKKTLTGSDVGQIVLSDLVTAYQNVHYGTTHPLLTNHEKTRLVGSLSKKEDIRAYNEYKDLHDFVVTVPMRYLLSKKTTEVSFLQLYHILDKVLVAENGNPFKDIHPMEDWGDFSPAPEYYLFEAFRVERLLHGNADISLWINDVKKGYREMYTYHAFLAITGEFCHVDCLETILSPVDEEMIHRLNQCFSLWKTIRRARGRNKARLDALIKDIQTLLRPIDPSSLQPSSKTIQSAKNHMSFQIFQGQAQAFIQQHFFPTEDEDG